MGSVLAISVVGTGGLPWVHVVDSGAELGGHQVEEREVETKYWYRAEQGKGNKSDVMIKIELWFS